LQNGRLMNAESPSMDNIIIECGPACLCSTECTNRVAQKAVQTPLRVEQTVGRGWGVFAIETIERGQFVCEYTGTVIAKDEQDHETDDTYLFEIELVRNLHHYGIYVGLDLQDMNGIDRSTRHTVRYVTSS